MALKRPKGPAGTLVVLEHSSSILKGNPLGDPHVRKVGVWLPPQYDEGTKRRFPVLYDLVGFTGSGLAHTNWKPFGDNVPERAARLIHEKKMGPAIIVPGLHSELAPWRTDALALNSGNLEERVTVKGLGGY